MSVVSILFPNIRKNLTSSTLCLRIIWCITGGTGVSGICSNDSCAGNGDDDGILRDMVDDDDLDNWEDDGDLMGTASATEVIGVSGDAGGNFSRAFCELPWC